MNERTAQHAPEMSSRGHIEVAIRGAGIAKTALSLLDVRTVALARTIEAEIREQLQELRRSIDTSGT